MGTLTIAIVKWALMGLGVLFLGGVSVVGYVAWDARSAEEAGRPFINSFLKDLSRKWDIADVSTRVTPDNIQQLSSAPGARVLVDLSRLGRFNSVGKLTLVNHAVLANGKFSTFDFVGVFENRTALTRFRLYSSGASVHVKDMIFKHFMSTQRQTAS